MKGKIHYAWMICAGCTLLLFCTGGLSVTAFSAYLPYFGSLKGMQQTQISVLTFVRTLTGVLGMVLSNRLMHRLEIRRVITAALVGCAASFAIYGFADSYGGYLAAAACAGFFYGIGSMIAVSVLITRWFNTHRGVALGICMASTGVSTFLVSPLITLMVENLSLRFALLAEAVFDLAAAALVWTVIRSEPSCLNMEPLGEEGENGQKAYAPHTARRPLYLAMLVGLLFLGAAANNISSYLSVLYQSVGMKSFQISALVSLFGISLAAGKLLYGALSDKIGVFPACMLLFGIFIAGACICCMARVTGFLLSGVGVVMVGFGCALASVATSTYASETASEEDYSRVVSGFQTTQTAGGLLFTTVPGILADRTKDYILPYMIMLVFVLVSAVVLQSTYLKIKREYQQ